MVILIGLLIVGIGVGLAVGIYVGSRMLSSRRSGSAAAENLRLTEEAKRGAEAIRREAQVDAREEALKLRADVDPELVEVALSGVESELERAERIVSRRGSGPKTARYLAAKGFSPDVVHAVVARAGDDPLG